MHDNLIERDFDTFLIESLENTQPKLIDHGPEFVVLSVGPELKVYG